ncbi:hypothetical protein [Nostoc sp.]|uniref:hypothetical protein n=1 Tax=Nostoc sp. TaxID=1180 RepID=UPI002FFD4FF2
MRSRGVSGSVALTSATVVANQLRSKGSRPPSTNCTHKVIPPFIQMVQTDLGSTSFGNLTNDAAIARCQGVLGWGYSFGLGCEVVVYFSLG